MGNDGGTIVKRLDIVRVKDDAAQSSVDPAILQRVRATTCALSRQPLRTPIVADRLGHVFNKESVVKYLLRRAEGQRSSSSAEKGAEDAIAGHIRGLKDVQTLRLTSNPAFMANEARSLLDEQDDDDMPTPFMCPLTQREMNGRHRFVYLRPCGCAMSESGLRATVAVGKEDGEASCPNCATKFNVEALGKREIRLGGDVVIVNGTEAEVKAMRGAMVADREEEQRRKKEAKSKKGGAKGTLDDVVDEETARRKDEKRKRRDEKESNGGSVGQDDELRKASKRAKGCLDDPHSHKTHLSTMA